MVGRNARQIIEWRMDSSGRTDFRLPGGQNKKMKKFVFPFPFTYSLNTLLSSSSSLSLSSLVLLRPTRDVFIV